MATNKSIPAMFQGVSQQPPAIRALEQCEVLDNGYTTVVDGCRKRPPSQWVKLMAAWNPTAPKVHQYFRGDGEHNIIVVGSGTPGATVRCFDGLTGIEKTVDTTTFPNVLNYLGTTNAQDDIGALSVGDTTFLWNRTKATAMSASAIAAQSPILFIYVKTGVPDVQGGTYSVTLDANTVTFSPTQTPPQYATTTIATNLTTLINAIGGYTATATGSLIAVTKAAGADFTFSVKDALGDSAMVAFKGRVERYSDLPRTFPLEGKTIEIRGQADAGGKSSFWVKYVNDTSHGTGFWQETVAPNVGEPTDFDATTMPVALVRLGDGNFRLERISWNTRLVGSTTGNCPIPSFVGGTISSMFFYRGRLGVLSSENCVMSRANNLYNFWPKSAALVADDDPIDVTANGARVCLLRHAVPFQRVLMLFSDNAQFPLTSGEVLSARTVRVDPATEFDCSRTVSPVSSGQDLFFVYEKASTSEELRYSGVREYFVNQQASTNDAVDVTAHVPQYIPTQVFGASVSSTEDLLLLISRGEPNAIHWYKYLWGDSDRKVQSAWGRWTFRPSDTILSAHIEKTTVHLVIQRSDGIHLEFMELQRAPNSGALPFQIHLDSLALSLAVGTYNAGANETAFVCPYDPATVDGEIQLIAGDDQFKLDGVTPNAQGALLKYRIQGGVFWAQGRFDSGHVVFGVKYEHRLTLSEQFMRDQNGVAIQEGRLQLKHLTVNFRDAVTFRVEVETPGRDVATYRYQALQLGIIGSTLGVPTMRSGAFTCAIASASTRATISLVNDSPYPATFYSAEWEGEFHTRSPRR
jgi:hypothetical protein